MSIQGHGIGTRVSFTHTGWRKAQQRSSRKIQLVRYRKAQCACLNITMDEYLRRFSEWQYLRMMMERMRDTIEREDRIEYFEIKLMEHNQMKTARKASISSKKIISELEARTPRPEKPQPERLAENFSRVLPLAS